jgi:hypothetical protein
MVVAPVVEGSANIVIDSKTLEQCLKTMSSFGSTTYYNICTNTTTTVPWGSVDWGGAVAFSFLVVTILGVFAALGWGMLRAFRDF